MTVVWAAAMPIMTGALAVLVTRYRIARRARQRRLNRSSAILVFGAAVPGGEPCRALCHRLLEAAELYRSGIAPEIVCYGGGDEVEVMSRFLVGCGVPQPAITADGRGTTTRRAIAAARARADWREVIVVSSSYHLYRIVAECRRNGIAAAASPGTRPWRSAKVRLHLERQYLREIIAVWWYWLTAVAQRGKCILTAG